MWQSMNGNKQYMFRAKEFEKEYEECKRSTSMSFAVTTALAHMAHNFLPAQRYEAAIPNSYFDTTCLFIKST